VTSRGRGLILSLSCGALLGVFGCSDEGGGTTGPVDASNVPKSSEDAYKQQKEAMSKAPGVGNAGGSSGSNSRNATKGAPVPR